MRKLNGYIMSKDRIVATVQDGIITSSDPERIPLYLKRTGDVRGWLGGRAIDSHRTNSRLLKKALRLSAADDVELVLSVNAATITDTYWYRIQGSDLKYEDVRFKVNYFDKLALRGDPDSFNQPYSPTPELTNIGSFEKCWRHEDGKWWMIKQGNDLERFSELFIAGFAGALGFPAAEYFAENGIIKSPDFTDAATVNYEAAEGIVGDDEDYIVNFRSFWKLSPDLAEQYLQIIYVDTLCFNMDRHTKNYGILRDVESGTILRMAPNYDNNIALFSRGIPSDLSRNNDKLIMLYCELLREDSRALAIAREFPLPSEDKIKQCAEQIAIKVDWEALRDFIMNGNKIVQDFINRVR